MRSLIHSVHSLSSRINIITSERRERVNNIIMRARNERTSARTTALIMRLWINRVNENSY